MIDIWLIITNVVTHNAVLTHEHVGPSCPEPYEHRGYATIIEKEDGICNEMVSS
jgi:hypothetical protein